MPACNRLISRILVELLGSQVIHPICIAMSQRMIKHSVYLTCGFQVIACQKCIGHQIGTFCQFFAGGDLFTNSQCFGACVYQRGAGS